MYNRKSKITMSIAFNIHTQRTNTTPWIWIKAFSINSNLCTWVSSHSSLLFFFYVLSILMLQYNNEGVYILFSLSHSNCLIYALKIPTNINAFCLLRTRANSSSSDYNLLVHLSLTITFKFWHIYLQKFLNNSSCAQNVLHLPHAHLTLEMLLHQSEIMGGLFHGLCQYLGQCLTLDQALCHGVGHVGR